MSAADNERLGISDVEEFLSRVPHSTRAILVGGQALNVWASRYYAHDERLRAFEPFVSEDIDFLGSLQTAREWAAAVAGEALAPDASDHLALNSAILVAPRDGQEPLKFDFLVTVDGIDSRKLKDSSATIMLGQTALAVMHPFHCLGSVLCNAYGHQRRRDYPDGSYYVNRARLALMVCENYLSETIRARIDEETERPYDLVEYLGYLAQTPVGLAGFAEDQLDTLAPVRANIELLTDEFKEVRWPQMSAHVQNARQNYIPGRVTFPKRPKL